MQELFDIHGFQHFYGPGSENAGQTGTMIMEYYGNTIINFGNGGHSAFRWIAHRGSWGLYYNNIATNTTGSALIGMMQYGPADGGQKITEVGVQSMCLERPVLTKQKSIIPTSLTIPTTGFCVTPFCGSQMAAD